MDDADLSLVSLSDTVLYNELIRLLVNKVNRVRLLRDLDCIDSSSYTDLKENLCFLLKRKKQNFDKIHSLFEETDSLFIK